MAAESDFILAMIEEHKVALQEKAAAFEREDDEETTSWHIAETWGIWHEMLECDATTMAGGVAFVAHALL